jgi:hypothetical protein
MSVGHAIGDMRKGSSAACAMSSGRIIWSCGGADSLHVASHKPLRLFWTPHNSRTGGKWASMLQATI